MPVPENYQWLIWGWPETFEARLAEVGSRALLMGPHESGKANSGVDSEESMQATPADFKGIIFTNRIDLLGPLYKRGKQQVDLNRGSEAAL